MIAGKFGSSSILLNFFIAQSSKTFRTRSTSLKLQFSGSMSRGNQARYSNSRSRFNLSRHHLYMRGTARYLLFLILIDFHIPVNSLVTLLFDSFMVSKFPPSYTFSDCILSSLPTSPRNLYTLICLQVTGIVPIIYFKY